MRTPLNGILSNAEILATSAATLKPGDVAEIGQEIHKSSERLARLIENFLIYAQLELVAADPKNVNALRVGRTEHPVELINQCAMAQAAQAGRLQDLSFEVADVLLPMAGEYACKVVDELTQNAFKFSEAGSPVRVTLDEAFNAITLSVSDQGRGFTAEQITRIGAYMQFDRKLHEQQGLGLGLTIAKRLVELHGGKFSIISDKESGTVVSAKFPKGKAESVPSPSSPSFRNRKLTCSRARTKKSGLKRQTPVKKNEGAICQSGQQKYQRNARHRREIRLARAQGDFLERSQQLICRRIHVIPERMPAKVDVTVQQMQRQQGGNQKFPTEITSQRDHERFFQPVHDRNRFRNDFQPRERPACHPPQQRDDHKRQKTFYPARPAINCPKLHFHKPVDRHRPAQNGQQQQPQINDPDHPRKAENGK